MIPDHIERAAFRGMNRTPNALEVKLPMPPSINRLYRSVGGRSILSRDYRDWKEAAGGALLQQGAHLARITGPVSVCVECVPADKRKRDIDNVGGKAVLDLLVAHKVIEADDSTIVREITMRWKPSGPPCVVTIRSV